MSPTNHNLEEEKLELDAEEREGRSNGASLLAHSPIVRTKRIRSARRNNSVNGMQRRRNKRIDW